MTKSVEELQELAESDIPGGSDDGSQSDEDSPAETTGEAGAGTGGVEAGTGEAGVGSDDSSGGLRSRLPRPSLSSPSLPSLGTLFVPKRFLIALVLSVVGLIAGGAIPFVGVVTRYLGLFAAAFVLGLAFKSSAYAETGLAGSVSAAVALLLGTISTGGFILGADLLGRYGLTVTGVGVGVGLLVSLVGHYFGRDLRAGVTREVGSE
jgi:hypothetical protein